MTHAVLLVPDFALQALRRREPSTVGKPVAISHGDGRKACILQFSSEARGIEVGLAVTLAMARCPGLKILPRDLDAENEGTRILVAVALTLSPRVEITGDGCCTIDLQGADTKRTEAQMYTCIDELAAAGFSVRAGAGDTTLLAYYAAQRTERVLVIRDNADFLAQLPLAFASPTRLQVEVLTGWGITTLGGLTRLPKAEVAQRLGTAGAQLWERAAGESSRVLCLVEPVKTFGAKWEYDPPVESMEPLLFRLRRFAECVALELRAAGMVADKLSLVLLLEDETEHRREFRLPEPTGQVDGWMRVLQAHLDTVRTEARVLGVCLTANPARPPAKQDSLFDTGLRDPVVFWENLARLGAVVGDHCVGTPVVADTWQPDTITLEKPAETIPPPEDDPIHPPLGLTLRRFRPRWRARVRLENNHPVFLESDEFNGSIRDAYGPFHISGMWWQPGEAWHEEIWQVEMDQGAIYQIARTKHDWSIEGVLD